MALPVPTSNEGSEFFNINQCYSFNNTYGEDLYPLSSQPCSEVWIWNQTGQILYVYDLYGASDWMDERRLAIPAAAAATPLQPFVIRGLTNAEQVSAKTHTGSGKVYWRTQFFSSNPR